MIQKCQLLCLRFAAKTCESASTDLGTVTASYQTRHIASEFCCGCHRVQSNGCQFLIVMFCDDQSALKPVDQVALQSEKYATPQHQNKSTQKSRYVPSSEIDRGLCKDIKFTPPPTLGWVITPPPQRQQNCLNACEY